MGSLRHSDGDDDGDERRRRRRRPGTRYVYCVVLAMALLQGTHVKQPKQAVCVGFANMSAALSGGQEITSAFSRSLYYTTLVPPLRYSSVYIALPLPPPTSPSGLLLILLILLHVPLCLHSHSYKSSTHIHSLV